MRDIKEEWLEVPEFPDYLASNHGRVLNKHTEWIKEPMINEYGIASINFSKGRIQHRRAVAPIIATLFLPEPERPVFDTPINLDSDRLNNHVLNLAWRPRWFAVKYHAQFKEPIAYGFTGAVQDIHTNEVFLSARDCAMKFGLLERDIINSAHNGNSVFPTQQIFRIH